MKYTISLEIYYLTSIKCNAILSPGETNLHLKLAILIAEQQVGRRIEGPLSNFIIFFKLFGNKTLLHFEITPKRQKFFL